MVSVVTNTVDLISPQRREKALARLEKAHAYSLREPEPFDPCLVGYWGETGSGKSNSATSSCVMSYSAGIPVVHNDSLGFGEKLDIEKLRVLAYHDCVILVDEVQEYMDRMRMGSDFQLDFIGALIALRRHGVQVIVTGQYPEEIHFGLIRRQKWEIHCSSETGGKSIIQQVIYKPYTRHRKPFRPMVFVGMDKYWAYYNFRRRYEIGAVRRYAQSRARLKHDEVRQAIEEVLAGYAKQGARRVASTELFDAVKKHRPDLDLTLTALGRQMTELRIDREYGTKRADAGRYYYVIPTDRFEEAAPAPAGGKAPSADELEKLWNPDDDEEDAD